MSRFSNLTNSNWQFFLIQGGVSSGKSQLGLIMTQIMLKNLHDQQSLKLSNLLNYANTAMLTERLSVSQTDPFFLKIKGNIELVEYITSLDVHEKVKYLYEYQGIDSLLVDYINLLTHQSNNVEKMISFMKDNKMKGVFIENTAKLKQYDIRLNSISDIVVRTSLSKSELKSLDINILKEFNKFIQHPEEITLDLSEPNKLIL